MHSREQQSPKEEQKSDKKITTAEKLTILFNTTYIPAHEPRIGDQYILYWLFKQFKIN